MFARTWTLIFCAESAVQEARTIYCPSCDLTSPSQKREKRERDRERERGSKRDSKRDRKNERQRDEG